MLWDRLFVEILICYKICFNFRRSSRQVQVGKSHLLIHKIKNSAARFVFSTSFLSRFLLPRAQEVPPCTSRSFIEHPVSLFFFFTRNSLCFVSRSILRGKPIPRLIGLTGGAEITWNLDARKFFSVISKVAQSRRLFSQRVWKRNFPAKGELLFREKERRTAPIRKISNPEVKFRNLVTLISYSKDNSLNCSDFIFQFCQTLSDIAVSIYCIICSS